MDQMSVAGLAASAGVGAVLGAITYTFWTGRRGEVNEVIIFPDSSVQTFNKKFFKGAPFQTASNMEIDSASSLAKLLSYLRSAVVSVDVCLMIFTCPMLAKELLELQKKGVLIRVVIDESCIDSSGCQVERLREAGIVVMSKKQSFLMHHKFAIIDSRIVLNGSFNWTGTAVYGNNENVIVTTNKKIVTAFRKEFNKLWRLEKPNPRLKELFDKMFGGDVLGLFKEDSDTELDKDKNEQTK